MIRGTTAQFKFKLPCKVDELVSATITFWQQGGNNPYLPINKNKDHCSVSEDDPCCLCVSLTPSETMRFSDKLKARVQLRAQYGDTIFASRQQLITVYPINKEVIEPDFPAPKEDWVVLDGAEVIG